MDVYVCVRTDELTCGTAGNAFTTENPFRKRTMETSMAKQHQQQQQQQHQPGCRREQPSSATTHAIASISSARQYIDARAYSIVFL